MSPGRMLRTWDKQCHVYRQDLHPSHWQCTVGHLAGLCRSLYHAQSLVLLPLGTKINMISSVIQAICGNSFLLSTCCVQVMSEAVGLTVSNMSNDDSHF